MTHVWVSGRSVRVSHVKAIMTEPKAGKKAEPSSDLGQYDANTDVIKIKRGLTREMGWWTLQHEMTHAMCYLGPLRTLVAKIEEPMADAVSEARMATARHIAAAAAPEDLEEDLVFYLTHL